MNILPQEHSFVQSPIPKPEAKIREPRFACLHAAEFPDFPFFPADTVFGHCRGFMIFSSRKYFLKLQISTFHRACRMLAEHAEHTALVAELSRLPVFLSLGKDRVDLLYRKIDATLSDQGGIQTIQKTGLHRTLKEIAKQNIASNTTAPDLLRQLQGLFHGALRREPERVLLHHAGLL